MEQQFKYFAFISYSSKDTEWGKRLQRKLEHYRMPATLCSEHGWERTPIKPVFFAPTDIQPGGLTEELQERLKASRNLIVICSPNSAKSEWVGKEIEFFAKQSGEAERFHQLGRTKQIHFFIVDGQPHSGNPDTECFNPIVDTLGLPEILGANIHERTQTFPFTNIPWPWMDKQRAYVQLISKLLGVEFDAIWQRHRRLLIQKAIAWAVGILAALAVLLSVWFTSQPVDVEVRLNEASVHNPNLPPLKDAVITLTLDNETKTDTIHSLDASTVFKNIPHHCLNSYVNVCVECRDFQPVDTTLLLSKALSVNICRNPNVYGDIHFVVWSSAKGDSIPGIRMTIAGREVVSDDNGRIQLFIPLEEQKTSYYVESSVPLEIPVVSPPCGPNDAVVITE